MEPAAIRALIASHTDPPRLEETAAPNDRYGDFLRFLEALDHANEGSRQYLAIHLNRTARTLAAAPPPAATGRALELGAYGYMASALQCVGGYREVRCAYLGTPGEPILRPVYSQGREIFVCHYDLFDAERDTFPYPDGHFDLVLNCEMIEHLLRDPMHTLLESARILADNGALLLTTPNVASYSSIARVLTAAGNPQIYSQYPATETEAPHVREYTPVEMRDALQSAGFVVEYLFTEKNPGCDADIWVSPMLESLGLPTVLRGEQMYCLARKTGSGAIDRYPAFLYEGR